MAAANIIDRVAKETRATITLHCEMEWRQPYTQRTESFASSKEKILAKLRGERANLSLDPNKKIVGKSPAVSTGISTPATLVMGNREQAWVPPKTETNGVTKCDVSDEKLLSTLTNKGYCLKNGLEDLFRLRPRGDCDDALDVIAIVQTYFDIACSHIIDFIPMVIQHQFVLAFGVELENTLLKELGLMGKDCLKKCKEYAVDDPSIEVERHELGKKLEILKNATNILDQI